jgi:hypothetical protein
MPSCSDRTVGRPGLSFSLVAPRGRCGCGALTQKDVKNAGDTNDVVENKGEMEMENDQSGYVGESKQVAP